MAYPTTPNLGLALIPDGDQAWGPAMRGNMETLDQHVLTSGERQVAATTPVLGFYETALVEVDLSLACDLTVLTTDHPAWVRFYGSAAARTEDAARPVTTKVTDGRGCYGDGITYLPDGLTLNWSEVPTFHNLDAPRTGKAYLAVTSMEPGYTGPINLLITFLPIESLNPGAIQGPPGLDGHTILALARDPLPADGKDGDLAINTLTWTAFFPKAAGAWPVGVPLVGAPGAPGTPGTPGTNGTDGNTILSGAVDPTTEGKDGDFYINTATHYIFGPKAAGAWPSGVSLVGPAGSGGGLPWLGSLSLSPPDPAAFTWTNQGSSTCTMQTGQTTFYNSSGVANSCNILRVAYTGVKRAVVGFISPTAGASSSANEAAGIYVGDTGTNRWIELTVITVSNATYYRVINWSSPTASVSTYFASGEINPGSPVFLSIYDDGVNLYFQVSSDGGQNWDTLYQQARTTYLANPNAFGFGQTFGYTGVKKRTNFVHWSLN